MSIDLTLLCALMAWVLYWTYRAIYVGAGVGSEGIAQWVAEWGWLAVPVVLLVGIVQAVAEWLRSGVGDLQPGDHVIYEKQKWSSNPTPRAKWVRPDPRGDGYHYVVEKTWTVARETGEGMIEVVTPGGKRNVLQPNDPHLRKAGAIKAFLLALRWDKHFPTLTDAA
jgi:hypothetical protein